MFAALFPTLATWLYFVVLFGSPWTMPVFAVCKGIQFAFPLVWILGVERSRLHFYKRPGTPGLLPGLASGLAIFVFLIAAYQPVLASSPVVERAPAAVAGKIASLGIDSTGQYVLMAVFYSLIHSLLEEYYWRWFLFGRLRRRTGFALAAILSSLAFTAHHVLVIGQFLGGFGLWTWLLSLTVTAAGLAWAWIYHRSGSLYGPWLSHGLADAALMWIGYRMALTP
ncbi:MAG TPA: type II CAAX endopeptidase family protein [Thermoanaerobaculia bacterium]